MNVIFKVAEWEKLPKLTAKDTERLDAKNDTIHIQNIIEWTLGLVPRI